MKYFTFVGSYGGAVKYDNKWQKLIPSHGVYALNYIAQENNIKLERINCPDWSYDFERYDMLPVFLGSSQKQKELANYFLKHTKPEKIDVNNT